MLCHPIALVRKARDRQRRPDVFELCVNKICDNKLQFLIQRFLYCAADVSTVGLRRFVLTDYLAPAEPLLCSCSILGQLEPLNCCIQMKL